MPLIYLDNNATTMPAPEVTEAMLPYFTEKWGNPSSMHLFGGRVMRDVDAARARDPSIRLTSFSILFARQKGDLAAYVRGMEAVAALRDGDTVLVAEGCTHHRQCNDIGTVKIPKALAKLSGRKLSFTFASGNSFAIQPGAKPALVVHCGGCMLARREVRRRIALAVDAGVPIVNYGLLLAMANGLRVDEVLPWSDQG